MSESSQSGKRPKNGPSIEDQLDSLMADISKKVPDLSPQLSIPKKPAPSPAPVSPPPEAAAVPTPAANQPISDDSTDVIPGDFAEPSTLNAPPTPAPAKPADASQAAPDDLIGDQLAQQIQQLLDDTKTVEAEVAQAIQSPADSPQTLSATPAPPESPAPAKPLKPPETPETAPPQLSVAEPAESNPLAPVAATPKTSASNGLSDQDMVAALNDLDKEIAQNADQAVAGEFESVQNVVNESKKKSPPPANPPVKSQNNLQESPSQTPGKSPEKIPENPLGTIPDLVASTPAVAVEAHAPAQTSAGASAADVARELDSQPENKPTSSPATPSHAAKVEAKPAPASQAGRPSPESPKENALPRRSMVVVCSTTVRRLLGAVNSPLAGLSHPYRMAVGWVGLLTLVNASILLVTAWVRSCIQH